MSGCSSGVEHNLAKVGVVSSNLIARSNFSILLNITALAVPQCCWLDRNRARRDKTIAA